MIGFAEIPAGVTGECKNTFAFTGNQGNQAVFTLPFHPPVGNDFDLRADPGIISWSTCGSQTAILTMNTECNLYSPQQQPALIAVSLLFPSYDPVRILTKSSKMTVIPANN